MRVMLGALVVGAAVLGTAGRGEAAFHFWLLDEAFSDSSGTVQFLEFSDAFDFENFLSATAVNSNANTFNFGSDLPSFFTAGQHFLVGTAAFAALPGAPTPDYIMPPNFFSVNGDSMFLTGGVQPPFSFGAGVMPTDGVHSLSFNGTSFTTIVNSPTNFAGGSGSVVVPEPAAVGVLLIGMGALVGRRRRV